MGRHPFGGFNPERIMDMNEVALEFVVNFMRLSGQEPVVIVTGLAQPDGDLAPGGFFNERYCSREQFKLVCRMFSAPREGCEGEQWKDLFRSKRKVKLP
jgi:hypothetical protein